MSSPHSTPQQPQAAPNLSAPSAPILRANQSERLADRADRPRSQRPAKAKPRHGLYATAWGMIGLIAGAYVFTLVLRQDGGLLIATRGDRSDPADPATLSKTQVDVAQLQKTVGLLESDVARIKVDQAQADEREKQMTQRVTGVESRIEQFTTQVIAAPAGAGRNSKSAAVPPGTAKIATGALQVPAATAPAATDTTPVVARPTAATVAIKATAPGDTAGDPASGILLARGPSVDALRLSWSLLNERHKGTLKTLEPRVVETEPGSFQLVAGPVATPADALKVCATLKARGVACQAADFKGNAL